MALYRVTLHPLAKHPGPLLGRVTDWYSVWHIWKGDQHLELHRVHLVYGWWGLFLSELFRKTGIKGGKKRNRNVSK